MTAYPKYPRHEISKGLRAHLRILPSIRQGCAMVEIKVVNSHGLPFQKNPSLEPYIFLFAQTQPPSRCVPLHQVLPQ